MNNQKNKIESQKEIAQSQAGEVSLNGMSPTDHTADEKVIANKEEGEKNNTESSTENKTD